MQLLPDPQKHVTPLKSPYSSLEGAIDVSRTTSARLGAIATIQEIAEEDEGDILTANKLIASQDPIATLGSFGMSSLHHSSDEVPSRPGAEGQTGAYWRSTQLDSEIYSSQSMDAPHGDDRDDPGGSGCESGMALIPAPMSEKALGKQKAISVPVRAL